jgi:hypothetical protein
MSDRPPAPAQIGDDAVRPLFEHLRAIGHVEKLDVFIYSRGGAIDVPWRMVTAFRQSSDSWRVLIPFRANSAATLLALGADAIVLGRQGELGPIDPTLQIQRMSNQPGGQGTLIQDNVNVEDVMAYLRFVRERAGLSDQESLSLSLSKLTERLDAVTLGSLYRSHSHIRDVARRMLLSRKEPTNQQAIATIVETLAERVYAHGHAIGREEATEIGLPVENADAEIDDLMWSLLRAYEDDLKLLDPLDAMAAVAVTGTYTEDAVTAVIESVWGLHEFAGQIELKAKRAMPPNLNISLNLNLQLPPTIDASQLPQVIQAQIQQLQQALLQQAQQALLQAFQQQAPITGVDIGFRAAQWRKMT